MLGLLVVEEGSRGAAQLQSALSASPDDNVGQGVERGSLTESLDNKNLAQVISAQPIPPLPTYLFSFKNPNSNSSRRIPTTAAMASYPPLAEREIKNTIVLFDVDGTLTPARLVSFSAPPPPPPLSTLSQPHADLPHPQSASPEILDILARLRQKVAIGFVGGSDLVKQQEQLGSQSVNVTTLFDFCFAENGLTAYRLGEQLASNSFIKWIGEDQYKELVRFILHYIADLDIPIKRGTFIEFRNGMINVSPVGRNASTQERNDYEKYDKEHGIRKDFVEKLRERFGHLGLTCVTLSLSLSLSPLQH
jgi:HAD superfamily hydrolase (TIGR01484 family)